MDSTWQNEGVNYAVVNLYLQDTTPAGLSTPYSVSFSNPDYTSLASTWNWEVRTRLLTPPTRNLSSALSACGGISNSHLAKQPWKAVRGQPARPHRTCTACFARRISRQGSTLPEADTIGCNGGLRLQASFVAGGTVQGMSDPDASWETLQPDSGNSVNLGGIVSTAGSTAPTSVMVNGATCSLSASG